MLIFLDIDGVLVPAKSWESPVILDDGFPAFTAGSVSVLQRIISSSSTVILTTSHRFRFSVDEWKSIFLKRGILLHSIQRLEDNRVGLNRKDEILHWFNHNTYSDDFIIIDDDKSLNDLPPFLKERLVLTSPMIGLTEVHLEAINFKIAIS
jgi:hypothetical protein